MRQPIVKDLRSKTKATAKVKDLTSKAKAKAKAKDFIKCPQGASRPRQWPRELHHCLKPV